MPTTLQNDPNALSVSEALRDRMMAQQGPLDALIRQGVAEAELRPKGEAYLQDLLRQSQIETGQRDPSWADVTVNSLRNAVAHLLPIPRMFWYQAGRDAAETQRIMNVMVDDSKMSPREKALLLGPHPGLYFNTAFLPGKLRNDWAEHYDEHPNLVDDTHSVLHKIFKEPLTKTLTQIEEEYAHHPEWWTDPPENLMELVSDPKKLYGTTLESLPLLLMSGLLMAKGHPQLSFMLMYGAEGSEAWKNAKAEGATDEQANHLFHLYGFGAACIEMMQLEQGLKLLKDQRKVLNAYAASKLGRKVATEGYKSLTRQTALTIVNESLEEMAQGTLQETLAALIYKGFEKPEWKDIVGFLDRRAQEAVVAATLTTVAGMPGIGVQTLTGNFQPRSAGQIKRDAKLMDEVISKTGLSSEEFGVPRYLGQSHRKIESVMKTLFGKEVLWFTGQTEEANDYLGWAHPSNPNLILLNAGARDPLTKTAFHELTHQLEKDNPEMYTRLRALIQSYLHQDRMDFLREEILGRYRRVEMELSPEEVDSEIMAEAIGRLTLEPDFLLQVSGDNPTIAKKIGDFFARQAKKMESILVGRKERAQRRIDDYWMDTYLKNAKELAGQVAEILHEAAPAEAEAPLAKKEAPKKAPPAPEAAPTEAKVPARRPSIARQMKQPEALQRMVGEIKANRWAPAHRIAQLEGMIQTYTRALALRKKMEAGKRLSLEEEKQLAFVPSREQLFEELIKYHPGVRSQAIDYAIRLEREGKLDILLPKPGETRVAQEQRGIQLARLRQLARMTEPLAPQTAIREWMIHLRSEKGLSPNTIDLYRRTLETFLKYLETVTEIEDLNLVTYRTALGYFEYLYNTGHAQSTVRKSVGILNNFFTYMMQTNRLGTNPFENIDVPRPLKRIPRAMSEPLRQKILESIPLTTANALRNRAVIHLLDSSGIRVEELVGIRLEDIHWSDRSIRIRGKGNKERIVFFDEPTFRYLRQYIESKRPEGGKAGDESVLIKTKTGRAMSTEEVRRLFRQIEAKTGFPVRPHIMRHTFATRMLDRGMDLRTLQLLMGHSSPEITAAYLKIGVERKRKLLREHHPRELDKKKKPRKPKAAIRHLSSLERRLAEGTRRHTGDKKDLRIRNWEHTRKGWILSDGSLLPLPDQMPEHSHVARQYAGGLDAVLRSGAMRIMSFIQNTKGFHVAQAYADALTEAHLQSLSDYLKSNLSGGQNVLAFHLLAERDGVSTSLRIEQVIRGPGDVPRAVRDAVLAARRQINSFFENQRRLDAAVRRRAKRKYTVASSQTTRGKVEEAAGLRRKATPVVTTQEALMKMKLRAQQVGSKAGYRAAVQDMKLKIEALKAKHKKLAGFRTELRVYIQQGLPPALRGRMLFTLDSIRGEKSYAKALEKLVREIERFEHRSAVADLKKTIRRVRKKFGFRRQKEYRPGMRFKLDPQLSMALEQILDSLSLKKPPPAGMVESMAALLDYAQQEEAALLEAGEADNPFTVHHVQAFIRDLQQEMGRLSVTEMPTETLVHLNETIQMLVAENQWRRSEEQALQRDYWENIAKPGMLTEIESSHRPVTGETTTVDSGKRPFHRKIPWLAIFGRYNYNLQTLADIVSATRKGFFYRSVALDVAAGRDKQKETYFAVMDYFRTLNESVGITPEEFMAWSRPARTHRVKIPKSVREFFAKRLPETLSGVRAAVAAPDLQMLEVRLKNGKTLRLTVAEAMSIYQHSKNAANYKALLGPDGIFLSNLQSTGPLTPEDIQSILDRLPEKARQCADNMSAVIELTQDLINEVSMKEEGYAKANVERYWHLRRFRMREAAKKPQYIQETVESRSQWKERVGGKDPVLIEDCFNAFCETMEITSEYVGMASPIRRANLILSDRKIQETIRRKGYLDYLRDMKDLLQRVQNRHVDTMWMESWYGAMTRNVTRAIFGFNLRLSAQQYFSILLTMAKVAPRHFTALRGLPSRALVSRIEQWSPYLRERFMGAIGRELGDVARTGSVMRFLTGQDQVINLGTHLVRYFDKMAICDAWRVCEAEVRSRPKYQGRPSQELFLDREYRREVTQRAEEVIRATQPTWDVLDRSIIGAHRNPVARSLTMFHSQREKMVQMLGLANSEFMNRLEAIRRSRNLASLTEAMETADGRRAVGQLAKEYGVVMFNIAAVKGWAVLYSAMVLGREEDWEDWAISVLADIPGLFYLGDPMKEAINAWGRWARGKRVYQLGKISVPTLRVMETARLAMYEWGKLLMMYTEMADVSLDEQEAQFQRTMEITWEALQYMFGLPFLHITSITQSMKNREE